ncbi:MAG: universal stress protein [Ignavibacteriae bacterium]|nr:universal stress protein [Ignavibacteriota bacterium]
MIKRILIPLDTSPFTTTALEMACTIARINDAELTGIVVLDLPGILKSTGPIPIGGYRYAEKERDFKEKEAKERKQFLLTMFREKCEMEGIKYSKLKHQGTPSEKIISESIYYDTVIMGMRTHYQFATSDEPGDTLDKILDFSITPIIAVPKEYSFSSSLEKKQKVLIPYNGSLPAARALHRFAQLSILDVEVKILMSDKNKDNAEYHLEEATQYLNAHSIFDIKKEWISEDIINAVEKKYLDWADFVVVGAHSKKGLANFMVGSLTKHLIKIAKKPVLIGQ